MMPEALQQLGISADMLGIRELVLHIEAPVLQVAETDESGRDYLLTPEANAAWHAMKQAALMDGIVLLMVSAFRSVQRQTEIIQAKLDQGDNISNILTVCAPPGYSEHHTGRAIDITTPDEPALEISFETTAAFAWLSRHAGQFGFVMTYPPGNRCGFQYEPWHWCFQG
jgi:D-alanyl-D-alanine carboxypeptidase